MVLKGALALLAPDVLNTVTNYKSSGISSEKFVKFGLISV